MENEIFHEIHYLRSGLGDNMEKVSLKRTPLYDLISVKAKMVDFAGFEMPIMFSSIKEEHLAVRNLSLIHI